MTLIYLGHILAAVHCQPLLPNDQVDKGASQ
jgi:hypothetical protein